MGDIKTVEWSVFGSVQGVGFRWRVKGLAEKWNVRGSVQNQRDGSVRIIAQATESDLNQFKQSIQKISGFAFVERLEERMSEKQRTFVSFSIER